MKKIRFKVAFLAFVSTALSSTACAGETSTSPANASPPVEQVGDYLRAKWNPIHFKPAIKTATNEQCLNCHEEILSRTPREISPAGINAKGSTAWYQTLSTYEGQQDTFHRRHLMGDYAKKVMDLKCNTCHQGNDPREEAPNSSATTQQGLTMRKMVDPYVCAMCHGQHDYKKMGMVEPWSETGKTLPGGCLTCHAAIKTERHQGISFLKGEAIETLAKEDTNVCYGCHGGRAWYRIAFPYSEKKWPGRGDVPYGAESKYSKTGKAQVVKVAGAVLSPKIGEKPVLIPPAPPSPIDTAMPITNDGNLSLGKKSYESICQTCHKIGAVGSPKLGDKVAWGPRIAQGRDVLFQSVLNGKGNMPPKGASQLSDDEIKAAIDYMINQAQ